MADSKENDAEKTNEDKELDELLDSALEDLTRNPTVPAKEKTTKKDDCKEVEEIEEIGEANIEEFNAQWNDEIKKLAANYESTMEALLGQFAQGGPAPSNQDVNSSIKELAEAASQAFLNEGKANDEVTATIAETLKNLSQGAEMAMNNELSEEHIASMFSNMGLSEDGNGDGGFMLQGMMQALLSKEVLYPGLKEIADKYPAWLEENRAKLDETQLDRYTKQCALMKTVCTELEQETESDSVEMKKERTNKVLGLMQQMEHLGEAPADLVGTKPAGNVLDPQGACCLQ